MRQQDPLALAVFGAALALLAGLLVYVFFLKAPEPAATAGPSSAPSRGFDPVEEIRRQVEALRSKIDGATSKPAAAKAPPAAPAMLEAGRSWRYQVVVEPPAWKDITLTYRTQRESGGLGVRTDFVHSGGKSAFHLGIFAPGHATHANTRFPGFFMYASYLPATVREGQRLSWSWPWQPVTPGRLKRFEGEVKRWENVKVPAGTYTAAVIVVDLQYEERAVVRARVTETLWYVPKLRQVVKVQREGRSPDEGSQRITAELVELR